MKKSIELLNFIVFFLGELVLISNLGCFNEIKRIVMTILSISTYDFELFADNLESCYDK